MLITDGAPHGKQNTKEKAIEYAQDLKDKGVLLVAAAVGPQRRRFKNVLIELATSKEHVLEANFKDMDQILGRLVASSCMKSGMARLYTLLRCKQSRWQYKKTHAINLAKFCYFVILTGVC